MTDSGRRVYRTSAWGLVVWLMSALTACGPLVLDRKWPIRPTDRGAERITLLNRVELDYSQVDGVPQLVETHTKTFLLLKQHRKGLQLTEKWHQPALLRLIDFEAQTARKDGDGFVTRSYGKDVLSAKPEISGNVAGDSITSTFNLPETLPVGSIVRYRWRSRHLDARWFRVGVTVVDTVPQRRVELIARHPEDWVLKAKLNQKPGSPDQPVKRRITTQDGVVTTHWKATDAPKFAGGASRLRIWVDTFSVDGQIRKGLQTQKDVSAHLAELYVQPTTVTPDVQALSDVIVEGAKTPTEQAGRLYNWVRRNINYSAVQIGRGGWIPISAGQVLEAEFGDCKGKANLLHTLLAAQGIKSDLSLVWSGDRKNTFDVPTISGSANHMVLQVHLSGETQVLDPTGSQTPFGEVPLSIQGAQMLPVVRGGAPLTRIEASPAHANVRRLHLDGRLVARGTLEGRYELHLTGGRAAKLRRLAAGAGRERTKRAATTALGLARGRPVGTISTKLNPDLATTPTQLSGRFTVNTPWVSTDGAYLVRLQDLVKIDYPHPSLPDTAGKIGPVRRDIIDLDLELPDGFIAQLPAPQRLDGADAQASVTWQELRPGTIRLHAEFTVKRGTVPKAEWAEANAQFQRARLLLNTPARISRGLEGAQR